MTDGGRNGLENFWGESAFLVGEREYQRVDAALSAMARGEWSHFERRLAEGLACVAHAAGNGIRLSAAELEQAATSFRYDRDLISAEETNRWLDAADLSVDDWMAYLSRTLLRERLQNAVEDILESHLPASGQLAAAALAEGICSRDFDGFEKAFAARAAIAAASDHASASALESSTLDARVTDLAHTFAHWLSDRPIDDTRARLQHVLWIERRFDEFVADVAARAPLAELVARHRLEWHLIELDTLAFPGEDAAREAMLCVTIDRMSLHDVAALSRRAAERRRLFREDIDADLGDRLLAIEPGAVLGPTAVNGHFEVTALVRRTPPSLDEPRVVERARRAVVEAAIERAARDGVTRRHRG
jgi:hypothetical protein